MKKSHKLRRRISSIGMQVLVRLREVCPRKAKRPMNGLVAVSHPDVYRADGVCAALQRLQQEFLIEMEGAAYITREQEGKIKLHQTPEAEARLQSALNRALSQRPPEISEASQC